MLASASVLFGALAACGGAEAPRTSTTVETRSPSVVREPESDAQRHARFRELLVRTAYCGDDATEERGYAIEGERRLSDGSSVLMVRCDFFAYQGRYRFVRVLPGDALMAVSLVVPTDAELGDLVSRDASLHGDLIGLPTFDPSDGSVVVLCKHRGPGDCGVYARFEDAEGALTLRWARARGCDDSGSGDDAPSPPDWPVVYP